MNYSETIRQIIDFIEKHIKDDLSPEIIARHAGYSVYHLSRVFASCQGIPLMDYVRTRRLSLARSELLSNRRIIDIACDYGYETASGFAKSFRREFGYSPSIYMAKMMGSTQTTLITNIGGYIMNPVILKKPAFNVAGYGIETNISSGYMRDIAAYWENYTGENLEEKMYEQLKPPKHGEIGICIPSSNANVTYLLGVIVEDFSRVTSDMVTVEVPDAEYAVFTTPPIDLTKVEQYNENPLSDIVKSTWKYIFEQWFSNSEYIYDESKLDFEYYDERCHYRLDATMDIYVPIVKKN